MLIDEKILLFCNLFLYYFLHFHSLTAYSAYFIIALIMLVCVKLLLVLSHILIGHLLSSDTQCCLCYSISIIVMCYTAQVYYYSCLIYSIANEIAPIDKYLNIFDKSAYS